jgi:hypothetical protein
MTVALAAHLKDMQWQKRAEFIRAAGGGPQQSGKPQVGWQ